MSIASERWPTAHLRRAVNLTAAGLSPGQVAATLQAEGVPVPQQQVTHHALYRHDTGELFPSEGAPGRWTAAKVTAVLAAPEADPADSYAAARAKLGSNVTTTLTIT